MTNTNHYEFHRPAPRKPLWPLEASAGTGKTWNIANFVADYVADGSIKPEEVVIVTFTKAATAEMRSRVRENIAEIVSGKDEHLPERSYCDCERVVLRSVLADFGQLRISTIHGFAQRSLTLLGEPLGALDASIESSKVITSIVTDVIRALPEDELAHLVPYEITTDKVIGLIQEMNNNPMAQLFASSSSDASSLLIKIAKSCHDALEQRKEVHGVVGYGDLLVRLNERLNDPASCRLLASTIKVLLIDEFQDTDSLQWEIFQKIAGVGTLEAFVVVGDPKQSIYGFRGGDVQVYREAVRESDAHLLVGNRRSTTSFVRGANEFFKERQFGVQLSDGKKIVEHLELPGGFQVRSSSIEYQEVTAEGDIKDFDEGPSWFIREVLPSYEGEALDSKSIPRLVTRDLPRYIAGLVEEESIPDPKTGEMRPVQFSDICILSNNNDLIARYANSLLSAGIPASIMGGGNVLVSEAATQWHYLLSALARPSRLSSARLLALSWFGGETQSEIAAHVEDENWLRKFHDQLFSWHALFNSSDRLRFFQSVIQDSDVLSFLMNHDGAERHVTDIQHIAEVLASRRSDSLEALVEFLVEITANAADENDDENAVGGFWSRRIDGDRPAVQVMTIHKSKGLQFPIVLLPYLTDSSGNGGSTKAYRAVKDGKSVTLLDVTASGDTLGKTIKMALLKSEHFRKAYVALTRGQIRNVLWTAPESKTAIRDGGWRFAKAVEEGSDFAIDIIEGRDFEPPPPPPRELELAAMERALPEPKSLLSYTKFTSSLRTVFDIDSLPDSEPDSSEGAAATVAEVAKSDAPKLRGSLLLGKVVHRVLQTINLDEGDSRQIIEQNIRSAAEEFGLALDLPLNNGYSVTTESLIELVTTALEGDLGDVAPGKTLAYFGEGRRLPEMGFDAIVSEQFSVKKFIDIAKKHLSADPVFANWLATLHVEEGILNGYLSGSLDAVLAVGEPESPSFLIVDYKTNRLTSSTTTGYGQEVMINAMTKHHYQLQALIYLVALHRFLRSRLGDSYDYDRDVAGAAYLFLRGMRSDNPGAGVVHTKPSKQCIEDLSDLLEGETNVR